MLYFPTFGWFLWFSSHGCCGYLVIFRTWGFHHSQHFVLPSLGTTISPIRGRQDSSLGGGNSNIFGIFTPKIGEDFPFDEHIFRLKPTTNQIPFQKFLIFWFHFLLQRCIRNCGWFYIHPKLIKQMVPCLLSVLPFLRRCPQLSPPFRRAEDQSIHPGRGRTVTVQVACATGWHLLFMAKFLWSCQPCIQRDYSGTVTCCKLTWILGKKRTRLVTHVTLKLTASLPQKWMVGRRSFPFGMAYFQGLC